MRTSSYWGFHWEYSWTSVAKIHCVCVCVWYCLPGGSVEGPRLIDERSVEVLTKKSFLLTSQSLCGAELFAIRIWMEGQWKDFGMQPAKISGKSGIVLCKSCYLETSKKAESSGPQSERFGCVVTIGGCHPLHTSVTSDNDYVVGAETDKHETNGLCFKSPITAQNSSQQEQSSTKAGEPHTMPPK